MDLVAIASVAVGRYDAGKLLEDDIEGVYGKLIHDKMDIDVGILYFHRVSFWRLWAAV